MRKHSLWLLLTGCTAFAGCARGYRMPEQIYVAASSPEMLRISQDEFTMPARTWVETATDHLSTFGRDPDRAELLALIDRAKELVPARPAAIAR